MQNWIIFSLLSAVFAALVGIFGKIGITGVDSTLATAVRAIIMASFLGVVALVLGKFQQLHLISGKLFLFIVLSGVAGAISWLFYFYALRTGPASGVAALDRLSVVFVLVFAVLFLAEKLNFKTGIGALLISIGAILMSI